MTPNSSPIDLAFSHVLSEGRRRFVPSPSQRLLAQWGAIDAARPRSVSASTTITSRPAPPLRIHLVPNWSAALGAPCMMLSRGETLFLRVQAPARPQHLRFEVRDGGGTVLHAGLWRQADGEFACGFLNTGTLFRTDNAAASSVFATGQHRQIDLIGPNGHLGSCILPAAASGSRPGVQMEAVDALTRHLDRLFEAYAAFNASNFRKALHKVLEYRDGPRSLWPLENLYVSALVAELRAVPGINSRDWGLAALDRSTFALP